MISPIAFGSPMREPKCGDCSKFAEDWFCTMNCGPAAPRETVMAESKERVRVQAGRGGGPKISQALAVANQQPQPATLYSAIIQAARDPAVNAEKMKTLVELQIQVEKWEAQKAFTRAFNALQFELPTINKDGYIDHGEGTTKTGKPKLKARYSTYPNLMGVCRPLLKKHGLTFNNTVEPTPDIGRINIVGYLTHIDGHGMKSIFPLGADAGPGRSAAQAWGSASSYGKRYNLILTLDIVSEAPQDRDDDGHKARIEPINADGFPGDTIVTEQVLVSEDQLMKVIDAIEACGVGTKKFCAKYGIEKVSDLPASMFADAITACKNYGHG
jgi:ERF superfamily